MIVLAANYVGCMVIEYLAELREPISYVALDPTDPGGYNQRIKDHCRTGFVGEVICSDRLADNSFLDQLAAAELQLGLLAWWPHLLRGRLLSIPERGWLNLHPSFLPYNRGKHPNFWCLADESPCGVALHWVNAGIDSGDVVARRQLDVSWEDTGQSIHARSCEAIIELFKESFPKLRAGQLTPVPQDPRASSFHLGRELEAASRIDLDGTYTARKLLNLIRARTYPPHPAAWFCEGGKKYSVQISIREVQDEFTGAPTEHAARNGIQTSTPILTQH